MLTLSGLIAPALPGGKLDYANWGTAINAAVGSAVNQGVNIALGLQDSFNWAAVAASAVAAPIASNVGNKVGGAVSQAMGSATTVGDFANRFTQGVINQVAYSSFTGGQLNYVQMAADAFGNALGNSIVDGMAPKPTVQSDGIGLTDEQYADMNRQVEAGYRANQGQFNDQLQRDVRQQQLQLSLQRDITRSLDNNPEFVANLPMPRAEFVTPTPTISRQARLDRDLMEQAIAGGVGTSLFNRPIENAFDAQLLDALTPKAGTDPRTGLRAGPTHENAVALGLEPRVDYYPHITAEMRPWDPAADARAKLAGNAIGSMVMNPFAAAGYLAGQATGNEDFALASAVLLGTAGEVLLGGAATRGSQATAALRSEAAANIRQARSLLRNAGVPLQARNEIVRSFDLETFRVETVQADRTTYRTFDDYNARLEGRYVSDDLIPDQTGRIQNFSLMKNSATRLGVVTVPAGSVIFTGAVAPQLNFSPGLTGGATQMFLTGPLNSYTFRETFMPRPGN